ncbi:MAG: glycerophosphodiester phosphodiesterase family protein [Leptospiraceae bacterium]|nr:glycerophosphodiester phosphodiesterase family protein [Leptospiraceae bacterium]
MSKISWLCVKSSLLLAGILVSCASPQGQRRLAPKLEMHGHRGARGLAPENTWVAFEKALAHGMNVLELDTVVTKDKKLIIYHDTELNPEICQYSNGRKVEPKPIRDLTLSELKELDCGSLKNPRFPEQVPSPGEKLISLDEFFARFKELEKKDGRYREIQFNIETKFPGFREASPTEAEEFATLMVETITKAQMAERSTVQSFALSVLPLVKKKNPKIRTSALFQPTYWQGFKMYIGLGGGVREEILRKTREVQADVISPYFLYVNADFVKKAHEQNLLVIPWTVNEEKKMRELLDLGVDGIITDYPDRLMKVVSSPMSYTWDVRGMHLGVRH